MALKGIGPADVIEPMVWQHIRAGALRWVMPAAAIEEEGLFLYFPPRQGETPKLRAFIEAGRQLRSSAPA